MGEFPKMISVDDHVVEPPQLWQDRLPAAMRDRGPRVERARWGDFSLATGASYNQEMTDDGQWGDYWLYEDRLIYVHKRHVTIPLDATPDGDLARFDRSKMAIAAITYDEMRPGCYEPAARVGDLAASGVDGSLAFPTGIPIQIHRTSSLYSSEAVSSRLPPPCGSIPVAFSSSKLCSGAAGESLRPRDSFTRCS